MSNIAIAVTANVSDVNAKAALLREQLRLVQSDVKSTASAMVKGGADASTLAPHLQEVASQADRLRTSLSALKTQAEGTGGAFSFLRERISLNNLENLRVRIADYTSLASGFGEALAAAFGVD